MIKSIEKNEVNIIKLFNWGDKFDIKNSGGEVVFTAWIRVVGEHDINMARVYSLRKSAELRKKLKTEGTDERLGLLPEIEVAEKDKVIETIILLTIRDISDRSVKNMEVKYPKEPDSDVTLEEQEDYQKKVDNWPQYIEKKIQGLIEKESNVERKRLNKLSPEELKKEYETLMINRLCENEMYNNFQDMCVYSSCYRDSKYRNRLFHSIEEYQNLPSVIKERLAEFYSSLTIDTDELKKLPEATP